MFANLISVGRAYLLSTFWQLSYYILFSYAHHSFKAGANIVSFL